MTKTEEMVLKTVHDLGVAGALDVQNYTGLSADDASAAVNSLRKKIPQGCSNGVGIAKKRVLGIYA